MPVGFHVRARIEFSARIGFTAGWLALLCSLPAGAFDLSEASIPRSEIRSGGPAKDGIPALSDPELLVADQAGYLAPSDRVVGVVVAGDARAYPIRILNWHEVVNDEVGGRSLAVTYCPLTGSAIAFDRIVGDQTLTFGVSGRLYQSNVLMYDQQTESLWSQLAGRAVTGSFSRTALPILPVTVTTWADWRRRHQRTMVLSPSTGFRRDYDRDPYAGYRSSPRAMFSAGYTDRRLAPKDWIVGVDFGGAAKAYRRGDLPAGATVDEHAGRRLRLLHDPGADVVTITDLKTGTPVPSVDAYWFAWSAFHPQSRVWSANARAEAR